MPDKKPKLSGEAIAKIAEWIDHGAPYETALVSGKIPPRDKSKVTDADRQWWAFQPLTHPPVPAGAENPVDAFLLAKAAAKGLKLNPPAEPRALLRRACLNLTGLPPSPDAIYQRLGTGGVDFPALIRILRERQYAGWISLDFNYVDMPPGVTIEQDMAAHRKYLVESLHASLKS